MMKRAEWVGETGWLEHDEYRYGGRVTPQARAIRVSIAPEDPDSYGSVDEQRAEWEHAASGEPIAAGSEAVPASVAGVPGRWLRTTLDDPASCIVWCHGGGLTTGSSLTHRAFASRLAVACGCDVFVPDYRLLPEHGVDEAIEDVVDVLAGIGREHLVVGGDSSGAYLRLVVDAGLGV